VSALTPHQAEAAYRRAVLAWCGLPRYAKDEAWRAALAAVCAAEANVGVGSARAVLDECLGAHWAQSGRCGLCGLLVDSLNAHLERPVLTGVLGRAKR